MSTQLGFHFDASACTGCKACQAACKDKNNLPLGVRWRRVREYSGGSWAIDRGYPVPNNVFAYFLSSSCMHCARPLCTEVCPTTAMRKREDGIVLINPLFCVGCRYCEWACPYGAPQFNEQAGVMTKCNLCEDLLAQGQPPACVATCPMRALEVGDLAGLQAKYGNENAIEPLPSASITQPSLVITPHRHAKPSGQGTGRIANLPEEL